MPESIPRLPLGVSLGEWGVEAECSGAEETGERGANRRLFRYVGVLRQPGPSDCGDESHEHVVHHAGSARLPLSTVDCGILPAVAPELKSLIHQFPNDVSNVCFFRENLGEARRSAAFGAGSVLPIYDAGDGGELASEENSAFVQDALEVGDQVGLVLGQHTRQEPALAVVLLDELNEEASLAGGVVLLHRFLDVSSQVVGEVGFHEDLHGFPGQFWVHGEREVQTGDHQVDVDSIELTQVFGGGGELIQSNSLQKKTEREQDE